MMTIICSFIASVILAGQSTYSISYGFWHRLLNFVVGIFALSAAITFSYCVLSMWDARENFLLMIALCAIPLVCGIWVGAWADKNRPETASAAKPKEQD
jgi:hypothetical protein